MIERVELPHWPHIPLGALLAAVCICCACSLATIRSTATAPLTAEQTAQLWVQPPDITARDLFWGPGGEERAPKLDTVYRVTAYDVTGFSRGYDAVDEAGHNWRIKVGPEVQPEIVASRLLWAVGFHQPAIYFLQGWKIIGGTPADQGVPARFRLKDGYDSAGEWAWQENPYVGTREFKGLLVAQLIVNNWDLKTSQNRIYKIQDPSVQPNTQFVVQDVGATLGGTRWPTGNRDKIEDFESQRLVKRVDRSNVVFDYHGRHRELFRDIAPADVVWMCRLFAQLTDRQWQDAFRAANYQQPLAGRFIAHLKTKVQQGLDLAPQAGIKP